MDPDLLEIPERALTAFENLTQLRVAIHDLAANLSPYVKPERFKHLSPCCTAVKATRDWACVDFEVTRLRQEIGHYPEGRYHLCHAGLLEWVMPVQVEGKLLWILFAGQRRPAGTYTHLLQDIRVSKTNFERTVRPGEMEEVQAQYVLEAFRQLRARLVEWYEEISTVLGNTGLTGEMGQTAATRRLAIQSFLQHNHTGPAPVRSLAKHLKLGESRTMHLVREVFGCSYVQLIQEMRMRTAASLLRDSSLPIVEVCLHSGFQDLSHFHRVFRKRFGVTPLKYRRLAQT